MPKTKFIGGPMDGKETDSESEIVEIEETPGGRRKIAYSLHDGAFQFDPGGEKFFARVRKEHALD